MSDLGQGHMQPKHDLRGFCKNLEARTSRAVELREQTN